MHRRRAWPCARLAGVGTALALCLALCLALAACAGGSTSASIPPSSTGTAIAVSGTATTSTAPAGPTATPYGLGTPGAVLGTTDACSAQGTPSATPPSNIPIYANAQMTIGSISGQSGVFGLCSSDSVGTIDSYYAAQLPAHGWQSVTDNTLATSRQLTAQLNKTDLIVTILPDTGGKTDILIIYSGAS